MNLKIGDCRIELIQGDITRIPVDAIVNAANAGLAGGGGVDDAIHRAAGPSLMQELRHYHGCPTGSAVVTSAGRLPAKFVFHAVGPVYAGGDREEARLLAACYQTCLRLAQQNGCQSISFPAISTGAYGYPISEAASVALSALIETLPVITGLREIKLVQFNEENYQAYQKLFERFHRSQMSAQTS
jgi:O-acetyl-ADP-ribose deacetylase (regulator of RNase III)